MVEPRLHLGCGSHIVPGWVNMDGSWNALLAKIPGVRSLLAKVGVVYPQSANVDYGRSVVIRDLRRRLPYDDGTVAAVYASHTLEHLFFEEAMALIDECFRVLKPGGVIRLVVPDLNSIVREYLGEISLERWPNLTEDMSRADIMMERIHTRKMSPVRGNFLHRWYKSTKEFDAHKWMYDADSLSRRLRSAGFVDVAERQVHDSRLPDIVVLESPRRVANGEGIAIEGIKPA